MKILIVHNRYQSHHIGGEDLVVSREIRGLKAQLGENAIFEYQVCNDDIQPGKLLLSLWGDKLHYRNIYRLVKEHKIDIVHVHNFFPLLTPTVFAAAKAAGAKVVHTLHNFRWWCVSGILYRNDIGTCEACVDKTVAWPAIQNNCYRGSKAQTAIAALAFSWYQLKDYHQYIDAYFVLSEFQKQKVKAWLPENKLWLKPNPIDLPNETYPADKKQDFLYIGRLESAKGIDLLLNVWEELPSHFVLNIIGSANDDTLQTRFKKKNIRFLGKMSHEKTLEHLQKAKYLIHPSLTFETFGLTLVEALAHYTPVIAIDCGPRREFVQTGKNGWLCEKSTLKEAITRAQACKDYDVYSKNARHSVEHFSLSAVIQQQISLYEQIQ